MDYMLIASLLLFIGVAKLTSKFSINAYICSLLVVGLPFALSVFLRFILINSYGLELSNFFKASDAMLLPIQLVASFVTFRMLERQEESIIAWFCWMTGGAITVWLILPALVRLLIPG